MILHMNNGFVIKHKRSTSTMKDDCFKCTFILSAKLILWECSIRTSMELRSSSCWNHSTWMTHYCCGSAVAKETKVPSDWKQTRASQDYGVDVTVWVELWADRPCSDLATVQSAGRIRIGTRTQSVSKCSRNPAGQSEFFVRVSRLQTFNFIHCHRQVTVSKIVSAIAVFRLVDNLMPSHLQIVHWPNYKLGPLANSNRDNGSEVQDETVPCPHRLNIVISMWARQHEKKYTG